MPVYLFLYLTHFQQKCYLGKLGMSPSIWDILRTFKRNFQRYFLQNFQNLESHVHIWRMCSIEHQGTHSCECIWRTFEWRNKSNVCDCAHCSPRFRANILWRSPRIHTSSTKCLRPYLQNVHYIGFNSRVWWWWWWSRFSFQKSQITNPRCQ